jgi:hypothetical protein
MCRGRVSEFDAMTLAIWHHLTLGRQRRLFQLALMMLSMGLAALLCRPILLLVFPGILLIQARWERQRSLSDLIPTIIATSLAFWIVSFWFVPYLRLSLSVWAYVVIGLAVLLSGISLWARRDEIPLVLDRQEVFAMSLLMIATGLRFSLFWRWPLAPAGADVTMHSYMAALIVALDTVPSSHEPLLPIDRFGAYPAGFQALMALMSLLGGLPVYRSALLMEVSTLSLLTLAFYRFLRVFWDQPISAIVALLVTFLPRNPQFFIQWGGDPTLLALALLVTVLGLLPWLQQRLEPGAWTLCACIAAASVLTHLIPVMGLLYTIVPLAVYVGIRERAVWWGKGPLIMRNMLGIGVISALLLAVCLPHLFATEVSAAEVEWVRRFQQQWSGGAWGGTLDNALVTIPHYLAEKVFGGTFLGVGCLGMLTLAYRRPHLAIASLIWILTVVGLIINSMYWVLPLSYALYPERVALLLLLPFSLSIGAVLDSVRNLFPKTTLPIWLMAALLLFVAVRENEKLFHHGLAAHCLLTKADLEALRWLQVNTDPGAVIHNHYGDAGLWIPAVAFRAITDPHLSPFYFDEFRAASASLKTRYVYVGKKKVLGEPILLDEFESAPGRYRRVYEHDGVIIYEIISY